MADDEKPGRGRKSVGQADQRPGSSKFPPAEGESAEPPFRPAVKQQEDQQYGVPVAEGMRTKEFSSQEKTVVGALLSYRTRRYEQITHLHGLRSTLGAMNYAHPLFSRFWIPAMEQDPHLIYGMRMLYAPVLTKAQFKVHGDPEVAKFVDRQLKRFWITGLPYSLSSLRYGYVGCETIYRYNRRTRYVEFDRLKYIAPTDVEPILVDGSLRGMRIKRGIRYDADDAPDGKNFYIGLPKMLWSVHDKTYDRWWGRSRYAGAFIPWYEYWQPKGFRNIRHLAMYKYSFRGPNIGYPQGAEQDPITGAAIPNVLKAEQMADQAEAGSTLIYPTSPQEYGGWEIGEPTVLQIPDALMEYGDDLKREKWEGLGVPPEVAESEDTGSFAGRRVPQQAFYSNEQEIVNEQYSDFDEQNLRYLVELNFGPDADYEIEPIPIIVTLQKEEQAQVTGHLPGDEEDNFYGEEEDGDSFPGEVSQMEDGRIEDRKSNGYNRLEKGLAKSAKRK